MSDDRKLFDIKVLVESDSADYVAELIESIERLICPFEVGDGSHPERCPRRWFILSSVLSPDEAAEWDEVLNE